MTAALDGFRDECGVFGVFGDRDAARLTALGLHALQHRGQEGAGVVASDGQVLRAHRGRGLVHDVFSDAEVARLVGDRAVGHVRYSTAGGDNLRNVQPFVVATRGGQVAIAHNGNLTNAVALRLELEARGSIFASTSDTEVILHLLATSAQGTEPGGTRRALTVSRARGGPQRPAARYDMWKWAS